MTDHVLTRIPSRLDMMVFEAKAMAFRLRRLGLALVADRGLARHRPGAALRDAPVLARIASPLWNPLSGVKDRALTAGKIQNLRMAVRRLDGIEVPAGAVFSFWRQIGRTTRRKGYVAGRELREGCLIPKTGGGLCQLSNALYEAALDAGFEIVERHAHSRIVPGSRADAGRDATVFWNYVDLRFRSAQAFRIEASLRGGRLAIVFRGAGKAEPVRRDNRPSTDRSANDCTSCNQDDCHLHDADTPILNGTREPTAFLLDQCTPEFAKLVAGELTGEDALFVPQRLRASARHDWPRHAREKLATLIALTRAIKLRRAPRQGRVLQSLLLRYDAALARYYARRLSYLQTHLVVSLSLLPHLKRLGVLEGRTFDVLMDRHPLAVLQEMLDAAKARHPDSPTLGDFRAPAEIVEAETAALAEARRLYTPHRGIAAFDGKRTMLLDWASPKVETKTRKGGRTILFPASALGRKGAYALRAAVTGLDAELVVTGGARERAGDFWGDIRVRETNAWPDEIAAVVMPALVEHQPRALLKARAMGLPVIATAECGLGDMPGVTIVPADDAGALRAAIEAVLSGAYAAAA